MKRLLRSILVLGLLSGAAALSVNASEVNTPVISSLDRYVVAPGGDLVVHGSDFSSQVSSADCTSPVGPPVVRFYLPAGPRDQPAVGTDSANCSNSLVHVRAPDSLTGVVRIAVVDSQGHQSNVGASGFVPQVTAQPTASVNPSTGQVGTRVTIQGSGLRPPSVAPNNTLAVTIGGSPRTPISWADGGIVFDPQNASGNVHVQFQVSTDANNPADPARVVPLDIDAGTYTFQPPLIDATALTHLAVGSRFHVTGKHLGGGGSVVFPGGLSARGASWTAEGFDGTVPAGAQSGTLSVIVDGFGTIPGPAIQLDPRVLGLAPAAASAGQPVSISGYNLGSATGRVRVGSTDQAVGTWSDRSVTFTLTPDAESGVVTLTRADGVAIDASNLSVVPRIDRLEANNLMPGTQAVVDGVSLGSATGTATIGSVDAQPLLWSRTSVLLQLPAILAPGSYPVTIVDATGARSNALNLTIIPAPTKAPGTTPKPGITLPGSLVAPSFDNNHDFVKPIKPPSPVFFNISTDPHKVRAGETADVVVVLKLNDKPLSGAQVKLAMLFTPGSDYTFTPDSGVTDATGTFRAKVKVSKTPGDSVIAATSGVFSDQDHVNGTGADGKTVAAATQSNPAAQNPGFAPLAIVGALAIALVAAGFYLNIRSMASA